MKARNLRHSEDGKITMGNLVYDVLCTHFNITVVDVFQTIDMCDFLFSESLIEPILRR